MAIEKILILDDTFYCRGTADCLESKGYRVDLIKDRDTAVKYLKENKYTFIFIEPMEFRETEGEFVPEILELIQKAQKDLSKIVRFSTMWGDAVNEGDKEIKYDLRLNKPILVSEIIEEIEKKGIL